MVSLLSRANRSATLRSAAARLGKQKPQEVNQGGNHACLAIKCSRLPDDIVPELLNHEPQCWLPHADTNSLPPLPCCGIALPINEVGDEI